MHERDIIHFLDLGSSEIPERVRELAAKKPTQRFVAVDLHALWHGETLPSNASYVTSDVIDYLKSLKDGSVRIANADFLLNELPDEKMDELIAHVKRTLMPNGKLYLSEDRQNVEDIRNLLHKHGFSTFLRDMSKKEAENPRSYFTEIRIRRPHGWKDSRKEMAVTWPVRIVATKRAENRQL